MNSKIYFRDEHGVDQVVAEGVTIGFDLGSPEGDRTGIAFRSLAGVVRTMTFEAKTVVTDRVAMVQFFRAMGMPPQPIYRIKRGRWRRR